MTNYTESFFENQETDWMAFNKIKKLVQSFIRKKGKLKLVYHLTVDLSIYHFIDSFFADLYI